jgi:hypothetical protein
VRLAALADLHCRVGSGPEVRRLLEGVGGEADALVLPGDLTDTGLPAEMLELLDPLAELALPVVAVLGNHDHESDQAERLAHMLAEAGIRVLEGSVCEIDGVGFVGTKGFCGGFDGRMVQPFGERTLKTFIQASIDEAVQLENALARLEDCPRRVAVLHYAPVPQTLAGESPELYPFLGSSRLASALDRRRVDLIVHGHAHHGSPEGRTPGGIPVHNVSRFVPSGGARVYRLFDL